MMNHYSSKLPMPPGTPVKKKNIPNFGKIPSYTLVKKIDEGSYYTIYLTDRGTVVRIGKKRTASSLEHKILQMLNENEHINRMIDYWVENGIAYFEMEYCPEKNLEIILCQRDYDTERLDIHLDMELYTDLDVFADVPDSLNNQIIYDKINQVDIKSDQQKYNNNMCNHDFTDNAIESNCIPNINYQNSSSLTDQDLYDQNSSNHSLTDQDVSNHLLSISDQDFESNSFANKKRKSLDKNLFNSNSTNKISDDNNLSNLEGEMICHAVNDRDILIDPFTNTSEINKSNIYTDDDSGNSDTLPTLSLIKIPRWANKFMLQIAAALNAIHTTNIIHMDVKPSNILRKAGNFILCDFNISKIGEGTVNIDGDPIFMAPEILKNKSYFTSDIFSLGLIYLKICNPGKNLPRSGKAYKNLRTNNFDGWKIDEIGTRMLERNPEKRATAREVFDHFIDHK